MPGNFKKNTISIAINNFLITIFGFVSAVLIARALGPQKQGLWGVVLVMVDILVKLIGLGTQTSASFFINSHKFERDRIINNALSFALVFAVVSGIIVAAVFRPAVDFETTSNFTMIAGIFTGAYLMLNFFRINIIGIFYALEKFQISNQMNLINVIIPSVIVMPLYFLGRLDIKVLFLIYLISSSVQIVWGLFALSRAASKFDFKFEKEIVGQFVRYGSQAYFNTIALFLQQRMGVYFIQRFLGYSEAGYFTVSYNVGDRLSDVSNPLVITHFPKTTQLKNSSREEAIQFTQKVFSRLSACYVLIAPISTVAIYYLLPIIFSEAYASSVYPAIILSFVVMLTGLSRLLNNFYASINLQRPNLIILLSGLAANGLAILLVIKSYGIVGVAWSMVGSTMVVLAAQLAYLKFKLVLPFDLHPDIKGFLNSIKRLK